MNQNNINLEENFFSRYIKLIPQMNIVDALTKYGPYQYEEIFDKLQMNENLAYDENKWTIKQVIQHCIDTERIMQYRALRMARRDGVALPGFEENTFAENADVSKRSVKNMLEEWSLLRRSIIIMYENFDDTSLTAIGITSNMEMNALAIGYVICGHPMHHRHIIKERYFIE
jgi:hypothetical protein